jgi:threonine aldolase
LLKWSLLDMEVISFRSDTETLPTNAMLDAMRAAPLGDDVYGEDPTVNQLEALAAKRLGKQAALLVISGTMGNLISLMAHANPGDEVLLDPESHIFYYEAGGLARVAGLMPMPVPSRQGLLDPEDVAAAVRKRNIHYPNPRLLCLENTHNRSGGRVIPLELHQRLCHVAHEKGLKVHLDGARIFNAAVAAGVPVCDYAREADSVMFCLSKGLSCPLGSVVAGSREFIEKARGCRKCLGGGMRQAGVIAAAGIVALDQMVERLAEDHAHAKLLAQGVNEVSGLRVDLNTVETNMVNVDHTRSGLDTDDVLTRLEQAGVLAGGRPPGHIRLVTNRHHHRTTIEEAILRISKAFGKG